MMGAKWVKDTMLLEMAVQLFVHGVWIKEFERVRVMVGRV